MPAGPGKYDAECQKVFFDVEAQTVLMVVVRGNKGNGFSVISTDMGLVVKMPGMLRDIADQLQRDLDQHRVKPS
jgi:hypothetical protein